MVRLIEDYPLAWVVSCAQENFAATLLPLRPVVDESGRVVELLGHLARSNKHAEVLREHPQALALFLGPQGYISPSWMKDRTQAPTWNYASAQFDIQLELIEGGERFDELIQDLVGAMEHGRVNAWSSNEMGARYERLASRIVGFRARVVAQRAKFKLGQDERDDVFGDIMAALAEGESHELHEWMQRCNPGRLR